MKKIALFCLIIITSLTHAQVNTQVVGCTDELATNYNSVASQNDGSCTYSPATLTLDASWTLPDTMIETSGIIMWNSSFWTHNDNTDLNIYSFDTANINSFQSYPLLNTVNTDWEEISQDDSYIYIGDFGNNANGNRTDLNILRISKNSLTTSPDIDTINFSYSLQSDFTGTGGNNSDFDCEAFIVGADSIYLFTKEWVSKQTSVYAIPKTPGTFIANYKSTFDVQGMITGATYMETENLVALCGYTAALQPFIYLLYDYNNDDFWGGNKRKISLNLSFHQIEGIATEDGLTFYLTNEELIQGPINNPQKLHKIDLSTYLNDYINSVTVGISENSKSNINIYPNPTSDILSIEVNETLIGEHYSIINMNGKVVLSGEINQVNEQISIKNLASETYLLVIKSKDFFVEKIIKQ